MGISVVFSDDLNVRDLGEAFNQRGADLRLTCKICMGWHGVGRREAYPPGW